MKKKSATVISAPAIAALVGLAALALVTLLREGPAFRRYLRLSRM